MINSKTKMEAASQAIKMDMTKKSLTLETAAVAQSKQTRSRITKKEKCKAI